MTNVRCWLSITTQRKQFAIMLFTMLQSQCNNVQRLHQIKRPINVSSQKNHMFIPSSKMTSEAQKLTQKCIAACITQAKSPAVKSQHLNHVRVCGDLGVTLVNLNLRQQFLKKVFWSAVTWGGGLIVGSCCNLGSTGAYIQVTATLSRIDGEFHSRQPEDACGHFWMTPTIKFNLY